ncbi:MAG: CehA/McbA family metallohydrolase [Pyrinomonadaceae bacterium]
MKATILFLMLISPLFSIGQSKTSKWYKGNTHTHTLNSDGDSTPEAVVKWYKDNRYNFVFITDHEFITPVESLNREFGLAGEFVVFAGQEVTDSLNKKPLHINGLGLGQICLPQKGMTVVENLQKNIDCVRTGGGVPQINHPNFGWALSAADIRKLERVALIEIYNGHPLVNNLGGGGSPGAEAIWDELLSSGMDIYGIADDDSHYFKRLGDRSAPTPGQAWIVVRAEELTAAAILAAMERGDFYASTGVELAELNATSKQITVNVKEEKWSKYTTQFIGRHGRVLKTTTSNPAIYRIRGNETYVRAKVIESNGKVAWTQPVLVRAKRSANKKQ